MASLKKIHSGQTFQKTFFTLIQWPNNELQIQLSYGQMVDYWG